jgi:formylglycine-generating enzyme required for sulfatase activity
LAEKPAKETENPLPPRAPQQLNAHTSESSVVVEAGQKSGKLVKEVDSVARKVVATPVIERRPSPPLLVAPRRQALKELLAPEVWLELQPIPAGSFLMGSASVYSKLDEQPQHEVTLAAFYLSQHPITQEQWSALMEQNPSQIRGERLPVDSVTWEEAVRFCQRLSQCTNRHYRLPTEAEWEYACRAGSGEQSDLAQDEKQLAEHAWFVGNSWLQPQNVGLKKANGWGLHDMLGNVWEWCQDGYDPYFYFDSPSENPLGPDESDTRVVRGGSWFDAADECRPAARRHHLPDLRCSTIGFRIVCES